MLLSLELEGWRFKDLELGVRRLELGVKVRS
jgi:hypothetical protein